MITRTTLSTNADPAAAGKTELESKSHPLRYITDLLPSWFLASAGVGVTLIVLSLIVGGALIARGF